MAIGDIYRVVQEHTLHGQVVLCTFHMREMASDAADTDPSGTLAAKWAAAIVPLFKAVQSSELSHTRVIVQKMWPPPPLVPAINATAAGAGSVAGGSLPSSVAVTITWRTTYAGKKYRGRAFVPGVPVTSELDSSLGPATIATWNAIGSALMPNLVGIAHATEWGLVVWHRSSSTYDRVNGYEVRTVLRNQRRRQIGKGR